MRGQGGLGGSFPRDKHGQGGLGGSLSRGGHGRAGLGRSLLPDKCDRAGLGRVALFAANMARGIRGESLPSRQQCRLVVLAPPGYAASGPARACRPAKRLTACHIGRFQVCRQPRAFARGVPGNTAPLPQVGCG
jgi:hypothetical protein